MAEEVRVAYFSCQIILTEGFGMERVSVKFILRRLAQELK